MSLNLKYRQLKAFAMVVETGSFRGAADRLAVTQPSLSALIKELESDIGARLFERTTRRCEPTRAGRAFYEDMQAALRQLEDAYQYVKDVGKGTRGRLSLAALPSLAAGVVIQALGEFRRTHPGVRIQLTEGRNNEILAAVRQGEAELAVGSMWQPDDELDFHELFQDRMMFVAPSGHPLETLRPTLKVVEKYDLILMSAGPTQHALEMSRITRPPAFEVEHLSTAISLVRNGLGISILPSSVKAVLNLDGLVCRPIEGPLAVRRLGVAVRRGSPPSAAAAAFAELLRQAAAGQRELPA